MEIHVQVLFRQNAAGRLVDVNEPPHDDAPRFFLGATKDGNVYRYHHVLDGQVVTALAQPGIGLAEMIRILSQDRPVTSIDLGPTYRFPDLQNGSSAAVRINESNRHLLKPHFPYTFEELADKQPCFAIVQDGMAVSICCSARQTPVAAEASLATVETYRGRAYSVEVSRAWAAEFRGEGRIALYSTAWDNFASQAVARKLQLIQYGTEIMIG